MCKVVWPFVLDGIERVQTRPRMRRELCQVKHYGQSTLHSDNRGAIRLAPRFTKSGIRRRAWSAPARIFCSGAAARVKFYALYSPIPDPCRPAVKTVMLGCGCAFPVDLHQVKLRSACRSQHVHRARDHLPCALHVSPPFVVISCLGSVQDHCKGFSVPTRWIDSFP
jgi:hypothetical protein